MKAYLNYPNPHMTLHGKTTCAEIGKMQKPRQRDIPVTQASFTGSIGLITKLQLAARASLNDVWFTIDFDDPEFDEAVARYIHRLLARRYAPLTGAPITKHC